MIREDSYLLVDGYNIIFDWEILKKLAEVSLESARDKLLDIMSNYAGVSAESVIIVFDAYQVLGGLGSITKHSNITVVFTKEAETADSYIEKYAHRLAKSHSIRVATSDYLEQLIILSKGATRLSARELELEVIVVQQKIEERLLQMRPIKNNELMDNVDLKTAIWLEKMRRGE